MQQSCPVLWGWPRILKEGGGWQYFILKRTKCSWDLDVVPGSCLLKNQREDDSSIITIDPYGRSETILVRAHVHPGSGGDERPSRRCGPGSRQPCYGQRDRLRAGVQCHSAASSRRPRRRVRRGE